MKSISRVLRIVGVVLIAAGLIATAWAFLPSKKTGGRTIPMKPDIGFGSNASWGIWFLAKFSMWFSGTFSGTITATSPTGMPDDPGALGWEAFDEATYENLKNGLIQVEKFRVIFAHDLVNDPVVDYPIPTAGVYYVVLVNNYALRMAFNVTFHYEIKGMNLGFFSFGAGMLVLGCPFIYVAKKQRRKEERIRFIDENPRYES